ncbi:MAG: septum formation initiator family protein [Chloroflexi bacterium]|nr:septum formation initiator family protein [Chloroflexota bacterium]MCL5110165.1 septum formation initiator family protein [Chloroflexota bacterium]
MAKRLSLLAGVVFLGYFLFSLGGLALQSHQLAQREAAVQSDIVRLKAENERLATAVARLQTPSAVEELARQQLGYLKPGETAVVVDFGPSGPPRDLPTATPTPRANWQKWLDTLAGR